MDWTEKHRPELLSEVRGNDEACRELAKWADNWDAHQEAVILYGKPGLGKTTAAHAVANEHDWDVVELNASETRTENVINTVAGGAASMGTLHGGGSGRRLVILDEADNLHGNVDRGGAAAMTDLVKDASQPVVLIANDFYDMGKTLRNRCQTIEFKLVDKSTIAKLLRDICEQETVEYDIPALKQLAADADGDVRAAVNDLQAVALGHDYSVTTSVVSSSSRDRTEELFPFLDTVLQDGSPKAAQETARTVDEIPDDLIQWIEENTVTAYDGDDLQEAYKWLSRSDEWLGRVQVTQEYRYWRYATDAMTAGVAASRTQAQSGWTRWSMPSTWRKLGQTRGKRNRRDDIAQQIAIHSGVSTETARTELLPQLQQLTHHCKPRDLTVRMAAVYELDASDIAFITGSGKDTNKVSEIVSDAEELRRQTITVPDASESETRTDHDDIDVSQTTDEDADSDDGDDTSDDPMQTTLF